MAKWGEIKCPRCDEQDALWEGMERSLEESDAREARLEAKLAQMQRTLDWTEERAKDYRYGREMMGHKWAKAEEDRTKAIEAMKRAVFLWEQPHYGDNDTIIDHGSEAIDTLRATLAELKGQGDD
jgi:uncharacterized Zn finger protein (UPF0148 family)